MNCNQQDLPPDNIGQSPGCDPKTTKRNSGLFAFLKWFKPSTSRESIDADLQNSQSSSCDSLNSIHSNGTVASFSYVPPSAYNNRVTEKCIVLGPETDTYKARLKQRDKRRENDRNLTLRKKYNLFFNRETLLKTVKQEEEENTRSLPLMTRSTMEQQEEKIHRRANSESSKTKKAGAYLHVKGKRKAPQPPGLKELNDGTSTMSLRRKKRLAPAPPAGILTEKIISTFTKTIKDIDGDVLFNDSLKLDHGILKPAKDADIQTTNTEQYSTNVLSPNTSARSSYVDAPVSPRPWYKRNSSRVETNASKKEKDTKSTADHKYEQIERLPDVQYMRKSTIDLTLEDASKNDNSKKKIEEKRKSGMSFLTNISELDREASEIVKKEHQKNGNDLAEIPQFMRPKEEGTKINTDSWVSPKRRSARDLIAKFNAITNVTKVTVNTAFFGASSQKEKSENKRDYFGKRTSLSEDNSSKRQESLLESHKKRIEQIDKKLKDDGKFSAVPLMKSESASVINSNKPETPKFERKSWNCPKCSLENEYWRIICHVCSAIKPYFDDMGASPPVKNNFKEPATSDGLPNVDKNLKSVNPDKVMERSKTQIGFSALASYNLNRNKKIEKSVSSEEKSQKEIQNKNEEREKLKKMLIEMKNSLPKRKSNILMKQNSRTSVIVETPDHDEENEVVEKTSGNHKVEEFEETKVKSQQEKVAEIIIGTSETIYENIKVKKTDNPKPIKVSASAQTTSVMKKNEAISKIGEVNRSRLESTSFVNKIEVTPKLELSGNTNISSAQENLRTGDGYTSKRVNSESANLKPGQNDPEIHKIGLATKNEEKVGLKISQPSSSTSESEKERETKKTNFELMRPKDFENIYSDPNAQSPARIYANLARNDELSLFFNMPKRFSEMKNNFSQINDLDKNTDTIEINRLLRRLESSIAKGELAEASIYAKELAQLKINCSVSRQKPHCTVPKKQGFNIEMYVEDKISHRGPFAIEVTENQTVEELKLQVEQEFEIPVNVQRWILGKELATDDKATLKDHHITTEGCPVFLYLVAPDANSLPSRSSKAGEEPSTSPSMMKDMRTSEGSEGTKSSISKPKDLIPSRQNVDLEKKKGVDAVNIEESNTSEKDIVNNEPQIMDVRNSKKQIIQMDENGKNRKPKIVEVIPKTAEVAPSRSIQSQHEQNKTPVYKSTTTVEVKFVQKEVPPKSNLNRENLKNEPLGNSNVAQKALFEEDFEEYDTKTLKPQAKEWECHLCTLLNPLSSNICSVCATVRQKEVVVVTPKKSMKKKAPQPKVSEVSGSNSRNNDETYLQLVNLDNGDLVENTEPFECLVCFLDIEPGTGVTLRECLHQFCKNCLGHTIEYTEDAEVKCPYRDNQYSCNIALQDREIKALVRPQVYEQYLAKSVAEAENKIGKSFHCKTPDCRGWCIFEDNVNEFRCPVCRRVNCLTCQAIHTGLNCKQYQEKMTQESEVDEDAKRTKEMVEEMVRKGEALTCPTCQVILMKKWGCDWVRCSMCKTEICWVTRGPRWGPGGKGDTTGGCQCGVNGVKCHPQCSYCH